MEDKEDSERRLIEKGILSKMKKPSLKTVAIIGGGAVLAVGGAVVILPALGFGAAGVGAGTLAAGVQSTIGNVAAGSTFALLQSAGVVGMAGTTKLTIAATGGAAAGAVNAYFNNGEENGTEWLTPYYGEGTSKAIQNWYKYGKENATTYAESTSEAFRNWFKQQEEEKEKSYGERTSEAFRNWFKQQQQEEEKEKSYGERTSEAFRNWFKQQQEEEKEKSYGERTSEVFRNWFKQQEEEKEKSYGERTSEAFRNWFKL